MCGLAGFLNYAPQHRDAEQRRAILERMGRMLERRGPDEQQLYDDETLSFVFRRLSIVDVEGGSQPIWNEDESIFVAVNGEIYNHLALRETLTDEHRFRTQSDSEIILHLYEEQGPAALEALIGMYAIVLWDRRQRKLLLARDRMGIKPLYYAELDNGLIFASELKALLVHPDCPRELNWADMVDYGPQQKPRISSYVRGVEHLCGGHYATVAPDQSLLIQRYWQLGDHFEAGASLDEAAAIDRYDELLTDSVHKRLMSDVPLGIFLSGGIDSSLIAAMAARRQTDLDCFTVVERTTYKAGDVDQARRVADQMGLPLHPVLFDVDALLEHFDLSTFEQQVAMMESPRFDPEWFFKWRLHQFARQSNPDLKVILLGQGADEFAGGYSNRLGGDWSTWADYLSGEIEPELDELSLADHGVPERLLGALRPGALQSTQRLSSYQRKMQRLTAQLQHFNLWHEDRTSSDQGIESRVPFLDHRLAEFLAGIPPQLHEKLFWDKHIVRQVIARWLPEYPRDQRKVAFFVTDDLASIERFVRTVVVQVYPDFRDKYFDRHCPFEVDTLEQHYRAVKAASGTARLAVWQLIEAMATTVFLALLRDPESFYRPSSEDALAGVVAVEDNEWEAVRQRFEMEPHYAVEREWRLDTQVALVRGGQVLTPLTEDEEFHIVMLSRNNGIESSMRFGEAAYWGVMMLEKMGRSPEPLSLQRWSELVNVPPPDVANMLNSMVSAGFVEIIEA